MSEKWKYILKIAAFWAVFMTAFSLIFNYFDEPMKTAEIWKTALRFGVYFIFGIGLGFMNWRNKGKQEKK